MFQGFNDCTLKYWEKLRIDNSKETFIAAKELYNSGIKWPIEELYYELLNYFEVLDNDLDFSKRCCISSPYNDARFCCNAPMKEYIYVRFKLMKSRKENVLGFYFDASEKCFQYGIKIYNLNARGMEQIRSEILRDEKKAKKVINQVIHDKILAVEGDVYRKSPYPDEDATLKKWLNMKNIQFKHYEPMSSIFFERELLDNVLEAFEKSIDLYFILKKALR